MNAILVLILAAVQAVPPPPSVRPAAAQPAGPLERSAWFAYVDRDYIFTCEVTKPGQIIFNFISMSDKQELLSAKLVRVAFENRKVPATFFSVDTGNPKEPVIVPSIRFKPRSSFGVQLKGEFPPEPELYGAIVGLAAEDFELVPLTSFEFENLALKANRLNLGSPDFSDDWRVLKLEAMGKRTPVRRRVRNP